MLEEGDAINGLSPRDALHDLRKSCEKRRYLMKFFQSLYPEHQIKCLIKNLKGLQEVLGDFQDYAVQEYNLKLFSEEMIAFNTLANTLLAMGVLIQDLDAHRCSARKDFASSLKALNRKKTGLPLSCPSPRQSLAAISKVRGIHLSDIIVLFKGGVIFQHWSFG